MSGFKPAGLFGPSTPSADKGHVSAGASPASSRPPSTSGATKDGQVSKTAPAPSIKAPAPPAKLPSPAKTSEVSDESTRQLVASRAQTQKANAERDKAVKARDVLQEAYDQQAKDLEEARALVQKVTEEHDNEMKKMKAKLQAKSNELAHSQEKYENVGLVLFEKHLLQVTDAMSTMDTLDKIQAEVQEMQQNNREKVSQGFRFYHEHVGNVKDVRYRSDIAQQFDKLEDEWEHAENRRVTGKRKLDETLPTEHTKKPAKKNEVEQKHPAGRPRRPNSASSKQQPENVSPRPAKKARQAVSPASAAEPAVSVDEPMEVPDRESSESSDELEASAANLMKSAAAEPAGADGVHVDVSGSARSDDTPEAKLMNRFNLSAHGISIENQEGSESERLFYYTVPGQYSALATKAAVAATDPYGPTMVRFAHSTYISVNFASLHIGQLKVRDHVMISDYTLAPGRFVRMRVPTGTDDQAFDKKGLLFGEILQITAFISKDAMSGKTIKGSKAMLPSTKANVMNPTKFKASPIGHHEVTGYKTQGKRHVERLYVVVATMRPSKEEHPAHHVYKGSTVMHRAECIAAPVTAKDIKTSGQEEENPDDGDTIIVDFSTKSDTDSAKLVSDSQLKSLVVIRSDKWDIDDDIVETGSDCDAVDEHSDVESEEHSEDEDN